MAFNLQDLYLTSGIAGIYADYTTSVHKFDSNNFYNWEQDNLPIHDLDERTTFLWSKLGYPTSALAGMVLTVSATGTNGSTVFATISEAIDTLPDIIRYPIIIEVCTSGNLGELNLVNLKFAGSGGLEIINRGFAKGLGTSSVTPSSYVSSVDANNYVSQFASYDLQNAITQNKTLLGNNLSATGFWNTETRAFIIPTEYMENNQKTNKISVMVSSNSGFITGTTNLFGFSNYSDSVTTSDIALINDVNGSSIERSDITAGTTARATALVYANRLSKLKVINAVGPLYIRGFCVDSGEASAAISAQSVKTGIEIINSDLMLENIAVMRFAENGALLKNSNVLLNRGFVAYRNYTFNSTTKDTTVDSAGLKAVNSNVSFSASPLVSYGNPIDSPFVFSRNTLGIVLNNSVLNLNNSKRGLNLSGGVVTTPVDNLHVFYLQAFQNTKAGIQAINSMIQSNHRISCWENLTGIHLINSDLISSELNVDKNYIGINAENSRIKYNNLLTLFTFPDSHENQIIFDENGQHLIMKDSDMSPLIGVNTPSSFDAIFFRKTFASKKQGARKFNLPGVEIENSTAEFLKSRYETYDVEADTSGNYSLAEDNGDLGSVKGGAFRIINSKVKFRGCGNGQTLILGPSFWKVQRKNAAIYAGHNSVVEFCGPTTIAQFGVDILTEDNSKVIFSPHNTNGILDVSSFDLSSNSEHHTKIQLHATRSCLVANRNSVIEARDLGDYHAYWTNATVLSALVYDTTKIADYNATDGLGLSSLVSGGYLQFYPNPPVTYGAGANDVGVTTYQISANTDIFTTNAFEELVTYTDVTASADHLKYSFGGMCVRALQNSVVDIKNVHFPAGWVNASDAVYNLSAGSNCGRLYIWNIGSDSHLHTAYVSVSGQYPGLANYHGPSAVWVSGSNVPLSGAPATTPTTASLSILDTFGLSANAAGSIGIYGASSFENKGPFRIYFSPMGPSKWIGYVSSTEILEGVPYQILAQGYNPSGNTWVQTPSAASAIYKELATSGFYYVSGVLDPNYRSRVWLDDSAMNLFANAKNATLGTSGRLKLITYYKASVRPQGEGYDSDKGANQGVGLFSVNIFDLDRDL